MSNILPDRHVEHDWWPKPIPANVTFGEGLYMESAQVFRHFRAQQENALQIGRYVSCYAGCSFSLGEHATVKVGDHSLLNGALIMAEDSIEIGEYCLISWNVGIADSDFHPIDPAQRRQDALALSPYFPNRPERPKIKTAPVKIGNNVWIGMGAVILKGVTIGDNSVVAAGAIVTRSVPPNSIVAGNPATVVKELPQEPPQA